MKLKILYLAPNGLGGMAQLGHDLQGQSFSELDFKVFYTKGPLTNGLIGIVPSLFKFASEISKWKPDFIQINIGTRGSLYRKGLFAIVAAILGKKTIIQVHSGHLPKDVKNMSKFAGRLLGFMVSRSEAVLGQSENINYWLKQTFPQKESQIHVVQNFSIDFGEGNVSPRDANSALRMLYAGRLEERKGVMDLISACEALQQHKIDWKLVIVGAGPLELKIGELLDSAVFGHRVEVFPWIEDRLSLFEQIDNSDIVVLPSYAENAPLIVIESFARSRPVLATNVGALNSMVIDNFNGFTFYPGDVEALADLIVKLSKDPNRFKELGSNARRFYLNHFTPEVFEESLIEVLCGK